MQPAQLSLLTTPDQVPAPPALAELSENDVGEAIQLLASLVAKASRIPGADTARQGEAVADE